MHEVPNRPGGGEESWHRHFHKGRINYLVTVDHFSQFCEVDCLPETTSEAVVTKIKSHFARREIPDVVVSDNGPQYSSQHFKSFAKNWGFFHETSSPGAGLMNTVINYASGKPSDPLRSIASRTSRRLKTTTKKRWNWRITRSSYTSSGFIQSPNLRSLTSRIVHVYRTVLLAAIMNLWWCWVDA